MRWQWHKSSVKRFFCSGMAAWSPMIPSWGSGSPKRPAWARGTCIGDVLAQTLSAGRTSGSLFAGTFCAAFVPWVMMMDLRWWPSQRRAEVVVLPAGRGHVAMREGRTHRPCRVARWPNLVKPLLWQLAHGVYCLSPAAQPCSLSSGRQGCTARVMVCMRGSCERVAGAAVGH